MSKAKDKTDNKPNKFLLVAGGIYFFYIIGLIYPDIFWGTHFAAFLPGWLEAFFLIAPLLFFYKPIIQSIYDKILSRNSTYKSKKFWGLDLIFTAFIAFSIFLSTEIKTDIYGDARNIIKDGIGTTVEEYNPEWVGKILSPNIFIPRNQEKFNLSLVQLLAYTFDTDIIPMFHYLNAFYGAFYLLLLLNFLPAYIKNRALMILMIIGAIFTCFPLLFFGHTELYASSMFFVSAFMMSLLLWFQRGKTGWLIATILTLFMSIKAHSAGFLLVPGFAIALLSKYGGEKIIGLINWKKAALFVILPIYLIGIFVYFFVIGNQDVPYSFSQDLINKYLFLPIFASPPPLDGYTMFSWGHIFDYFNQIFFWPLASMFIFLSIFFFKRKKANWNSPVIIVTGVSLILYISMFFATNPLLSMPRDWDLFSLPAPVFLFFSIALIKQFEDDEKLIKKMTGPIIALSILILPFFIVNLNGDYISKRIESMGMRIYNTYWVNSSYVINVAMKSDADDKQKYIDRYVHVFNKIEPKYKGKNFEYSLMASKIGNFFVENKMPKEALKYYEIANEYYPNEKIILLSLGMAYYSIRNYTNALRTAENLLTIDGSNPDFLMLALNSSYKLKKMDKVKIYGMKYIKLRPNDKEIRNLLVKLGISE